MVTMSLPASHRLRETLHCQILHVLLKSPPVRGVPDAGMCMVFEGHHTAK